MELGDISKVLNDKNADAIRIPDLDWLMLSKDDMKNIPTPHNVEIIPELQQAWGNTDKASARLISNKQRMEPRFSNKIAAEDIQDVVNTAKIEMMKGAIGKDLSQKIASLYPEYVLRAAKDKLASLSEEQGLLGNVYVDLSPFDSCEQAAKILGKDKIKLAQYVIGEPKRKVCATHKEGHCKVFNKKVADTIDYNDNLMEEYTDRMKVAGMIGSNDAVGSREELRDAIIAAMSPRQREAIEEIPQVEAERPVNASVKDMTAILMQKERNILASEKDSEEDHLRKVLAFIQEQMMDGKIGNDLKEIIADKIPNVTIEKYANEIKKVASLQGLLGNVYVDLSYYKNADEAIRSIKNASTSPSYLVHTERADDLDNRMEVVAAATGCEILPRNGKISSDVANSYIEDLQYQKKISSDTAQFARNRIAAGDNVLKVLREAFISTMGYKPPQRITGQESGVYSGGQNKYATDNKRFEKAASMALEQGLAVNKIEDKISEHIPVSEAMAVVRGVLATMDVVDADSLTDCTKRSYQLQKTARIKKASKCDTCVRATCEGCSVLGLRFASVEENPMIEMELDPKTEKVLLKENPDIARQNILDEYEVPSNAGMNINMDLELARSFEASDIKITRNPKSVNDALK